MYKTLVTTLDGSELAEQALGPATDLARQIQARMVLVQAVDSLAQRMAHTSAILETPGAATANFELLQASLDAEKEVARNYLAAVRDRLAAAGVECEAFVGEGAAAEVILSVVEQQGADMIVICTHGRGGLKRVLFGSTADAVIRNSKVPVLLIRAKEGDQPVKPSS